MYINLSNFFFKSPKILPTAPNKNVDIHWNVFLSRFLTATERKSIHNWFEWYQKRGEVDLARFMRMASINQSQKNILFYKSFYWCLCDKYNVIALIWFKSGILYAMSEVNLGSIKTFNTRSQTCCLLRIFAFIVVDSNFAVTTFTEILFMNRPNILSSLTRIF